MSKNKYLRKNLIANEINYGINSKNKEKTNLNGLNQLSENNNNKITSKSKVKLSDKKNDENEKNIKIIDEQNIEYKKKNSKIDDKYNLQNGDNIIKEENIFIYEKRIKELEDTINKMNLDFAKELEKHNNEIIEKEKCIKKLVNSNNSLKKSLEVLTQRLDKIIINTNIPKQKINNKIFNDKQEDLQHQLDIKEKELKNQQQLIKILTKDNQNIRKILTDFELNTDNNNNVSLTDKIHEQYQEIQKLQKSIKELKAKNSSFSQQRKDDNKKSNFKTDTSNKFNLRYFINKSKKISSMQNSGANLHKLYSNKSQNDLKVKKKIF